ncbi:hypothetical protein E4U41_005442, partial [Claviceps citrina]
DPSHDSSAFHIHAPSPQSAAIAHVLVTEIAPNYWTLLHEASPARDDDDASAASDDAGRLVRCLQSVTGLNAIVGHVKALLLVVGAEESQTSGRPGRRHAHPPRSDVKLHLAIFLHLLATLLEGGDAVRHLWHSSTASLADAGSRKVQTQLLVSLLTGGKVPSLAGETARVLGADAVPPSARCLADGLDFSRWMARNVAAWAKRLPPGHGPELESCVDVFQRSLSLGYADTMVTLCVDELLLSHGVPRDVFSRVCLHQAHVSKRVLHTLLAHLSQRLLDPLGPQHATPSETVSAVAGIIDGVLQADQPARAAQLAAHL